MLSILPAFSSPDLKVFPLHLRHYRSYGSTPSLPNLPRAGRAWSLSRTVPSCFASVPSPRAQAARLCDLFRSATAPLHKSHRLAYPRINVVGFLILSVGLCQSRKDPYLPLQPSCVRLLPRPTGLPAHGSRSNLPSAYADVKSLPPPSSGKGNSRLGSCGCLSVISRPRLGLVVYLWFDDGPFQVLLCYLCG